MAMKTRPRGIDAVISLAFCSFRSPPELLISVLRAKNCWTAMINAAVAKPTPGDKPNNKLAFMWLPLGVPPPAENSVKDTKAITKVAITPKTRKRAQCRNCRVRAAERTKKPKLTGTTTLLITTPPPTAKPKNIPITVPAERFAKATKSRPIGMYFNLLLEIPLPRNT
jgi:hypothetical protein